MESSAVESIPPVIKRRRYSSSCSFCGIMAQTVRSINFTNHININTLQILKQVWKADSLKETATAGSLVPIIFSTNHDTPCVKGTNRHNTHITPNTLNTRCANAALLACVLPVSAARLAVMVVPIFSPRTSAAPSSKLIQPFAHMISVIAIVAAEACTIMVSTVPISTKSSTDIYPISV